MVQYKISSSLTHCINSICHFYTKMTLAGNDQSESDHIEGTVHFVG
jgi:hypothetical protein